jgi:uncharacterized membrane protein YqjE
MDASFAPDDANDKADLARVATARSTAGVLRVLAWIVAAVGLVSVIVFVILLVIGDVTLEQFFAALFTFGILTILAGGSAYASASNLDLSASRVERDVNRGRSRRQ